jgi:hypothetical protein
LVRPAVIQACPSAAACGHPSLLLLTALMLTFTGCGTLHGSAQIGTDLKPRSGTSISVPLGK